jgi:hypothetical protein
MMGTSKRDNVAIPPEARKAVDMLKIWRACVDAMMKIALEKFKQE